MTKQHSHAAKHPVQMQKRAPEKYIVKHNKHNIDLIHDGGKGRGRKRSPEIPPGEALPEAGDNKPVARNNATVLSRPLFSRQEKGGEKAAPVIDIYSLFKYTWQFWAGVINPWNAWGMFMPFLHFYQKPQSPGRKSLSNYANNYALENLRSESWETETGYFYEVDLPGVEHEQLMLGFHNGAIMLRVEELDNSKKYRHPHFLRRAFIPPVYIDSQGINAKLQNGKLIISIPKAERPASRQSRLIDIM